jgi:hypothetical protein
VNGLDNIFDEAYSEGKRPDRSIANELVSRLSKNNYIPSAAWIEYEEVVLREFKRFVEAREKREAGNPHL